MAYITNKPEWFDLNNYPDFNKSHIKPEWKDEAEWIYNFNARKNVINELNSSGTISTQLRAVIDLFQEKGFIAREIKIKTSPNVQPLLIKDIGDLYQSVTGNEKIQLDKYNKKTKKIYDDEWNAMPVLDFTETVKLTEKEGKQIITDFIKLPTFTKKQNELMEIGNAVEKIYHETPFSKGGSIAYISINLNAPSNTLVDEFTSFVKAQKEKNSIKYKTEITLAKIKKWAKYQVLAYLDLFIYSLEQKSDIKQKHYGDWLYPNEYDADTTEMFRKITKKMAGEVLNPDFLKYTASQSNTSLI